MTMINANRAIANYLDQRDLKHSCAEDGTYVVGFNDGARALRVMIGHGGWAADGIGIVVQGEASVARDQWPKALAACNQWNAHARLPKAHLHATDWDRGVDAVLLLEAWLPVADGLVDEAQFATFADQSLRGGLAFWAPDAAQQAGDTGEGRPTRSTQ